MERVRHVVSHHYGVTQLAIVVSGIEAYELLRRLMQPNWPLAEQHARDVISLERVMHVEWEVAIQHAFLRAPDVVRAMNVFYVAGHFVVTGVFFLWLYHRSRPGFRRFRDGFLTGTAIALVIHWQFPTAPPRLAGVGLEDTLRQLSSINIGSPASSSFSNPVAAMPSLHAGWALGVGVGLVLYARPLLWRAVGVLYPMGVVLTIVVTGNHFVLDAVSGMAVLGVGFAVAELLFARRRVLQSPPRRGVEQPGSSPGS